MAASEDPPYVGREQTLVKHFILQKYLERFAHIVGSRWDVLTYVDCFSGPWNARSEKFEDSSFAIALKELRNARATLAKRGRSVQLRCFFLEKNRSAYAKLKEYADSVTDVNVETRNAALEDSITEIVDFVQRGGANSFPFVFIDPTGWTGFGMQTIAPLLRLNPGEVLINFMTGHIRRFLDSPQEETQDSFRQLFGSGAFRAKVQGLAKQDREDAAIEEYSRNVRQTGGFTQTCTAIVLHPELDRTHFNLIYATRNPKGIEVFKDAEKKAMAVQETARAEAEQRRRETRTGQLDLLASGELHDASHYNSLRARYLAKSRGAVQRALQAKRRLLYDDAWMLALCEPMVWESDLKEWIEEWVRAGQLEVGGMRDRQRVPHRDEQNYLISK
jgi:three-Cys-motif partner protein